MLAPFRYSDRGWFDYNPMLASVPVALWHHGSDPADRRRLEELRRAAGYDWRTVRSFRSKEEAGHEEPWFTFLAGHNPDYPEKILAAAQAQVGHRLARMQAYRDVDVAEADIHLWQQCNPVVTEALVQLTWEARDPDRRAPDRRGTESLSGQVGALAGGRAVAGVGYAAVGRGGGVA
jgi:hypothetical protein